MKCQWCFTPRCVGSAHDDMAKRILKLVCQYNMLHPKQQLDATLCECVRPSFTDNPVETVRFVTMRLKQLEKLEVFACQRALNQSLGDTWFDSYAASTWTSMHVRWLVRQKKTGAILHCISPLGIKCAASEANLVYSMDGIVAGGNATMGTPILQLMIRSLNNNDRGWLSVAKSVISKYSGIRNLLVHSLCVGLTGLHPFINPGHRPNWFVREVAAQCMSSVVSTEGSLKFLNKRFPLIRENTRRMFFQCIDDSRAAASAFMQSGHVVNAANGPPNSLLSSDMALAMQRLANAGCFQMHDSQLLQNDVPNKQNIVWSHNSTRHASQVSAVERAKCIFEAGFQSNFAPFWLCCSDLSMRHTVLDRSQYDTLHGQNAASILCSSIPDDIAIQAQQMALSDTAAFFHTTDFVMNKLGPNATNHGICMKKTGRHAATTLAYLSEFGSTGVAQFLEYTRMAWIAEQLLIVDLGADTRALQVRAINTRARILKLDNNPPAHLTCLYYCTSCRRVTNAMCNKLPKHLRKASLQAINGTLEYGMVSVASQSNNHAVYQHDDTDTASTNMFCTKRSSASQRNAIQEAMRATDFDILTPEEPSVQTVISRVDQQYSGVVGITQFRRSLKAARHQKRHTVHCGTDPLIAIPLLGRAIRVRDKWHGICVYCGIFFVVKGKRFLGSELCCMECEKVTQNIDSSMSEAISHKRTFMSSPYVSSPMCRFCGKKFVAKGSKFEMVMSPYDDTEDNANTPNELRFTYWCSIHYRKWLHAFLKTRNTRDALIYIATKARPMPEYDIEAPSCSTSAQLNNMKSDSSSLKTQFARKRKNVQTLNGKKRKRAQLNAQVSSIRTSKRNVAPCLNTVVCNSDNDSYYSE